MDWFEWVTFYTGAHCSRAGHTHKHTLARSLARPTVPQSKRGVNSMQMHFMCVSTWSWQLKIEMNYDFLRDSCESLVRCHTSKRTRRYSRGKRRHTHTYALCVVASNQRNGMRLNAKCCFNIIYACCLTHQMAVVCETMNAKALVSAVRAFGKQSKG